MKSMIALLIAALSILFCVSCAQTAVPPVSSGEPIRSSSVTPTGDRAEALNGGKNEEFYRSASSYYYRNLFFGCGPKIAGDNNTYTLEYVDFSLDELTVLPVYYDVFDEKNDPFFGSYHFDKLLVDREETEKNGGVPVLIVAHSAYTDHQNGYVYRFLSYNMATGLLTQLYDLDECLFSEFVLYHDTIYFTVLQQEEEDATEKYVFYKMPKTGGPPERLVFPEEDVPYSFVYANNDKLYLQSDELGKVYCCDSEFKECKVVWQSKAENVPFFYFDNYAYYKAEQKSYKEEGKQTVQYCDLRRKPIDKLANEGSELIIEDVLWILQYRGGGAIYYYSMKDLQFSRKTGMPDRSILRSLDLNDRTESVVYDFSNQLDSQFAVMYCNDDYCEIYVLNHPELKAGDYIFERNTGKMKRFDFFRIDEWTNKK